MFPASKELAYPRKSNALDHRNGEITRSICRHVLVDMREAAVKKDELVFGG